MLKSETIIQLFLSFFIIYFIIKKFILLFLNRIREVNDIRKNGEKANGIIIDYIIEKDPNGVATYLPTVEYIVDNKHIRTTIQHPKNEKPVIGKSVIVYYSKSDIENAIIDIDDALFRNFIVVIFLTLIIVLIIIFLIRSLIK